MTFRVENSLCIQKKLQLFVYINNIYTVAVMTCWTNEKAKKESKV